MGFKHTVFIAGILIIGDKNGNNTDTYKRAGVIIILKSNGTNVMFLFVSFAENGWNDICENVQPHRVRNGTIANANLMAGFNFFLSKNRNTQS